MSDSTTAVPVDVEGARKVFGSKVALDDVNLAVPAGAFCVLLGPSGSGKTTLLRCTAGIERLTAGRITIGAQLVADGPTHLSPEKRNLSMVFQDYALWPHMTAHRNVEFALRRRGLAKPAIATRVQEMLERVGLGHLGHRYPNEMSGGEQQRVALARALVAGTGVLLFDEPLSNLDADLRERMRLEIATLARDSGATSIYITHDQSEAFALADFIGVLHEGRLVQFAAPEVVYHQPATPFVARFTGLAGELNVIVTGGPTSSEDGAPTLRVRPAETGHDGLAEIVASAPAGARLAGTATLMVRSAGVELLPPGEPECHFDAVVVDVAYRGRGYDYAVLVGQGTRLVGIHDKRRWSRGELVSLRLAPSACMLFPPDADQGAESADPALAIN